MSIYVVRHAETTDNAAHIIQRPDAALSARGRDQAERLADRIAALGVARILTSDFRRAIETASYVSARTGIDAEADPLLRERNFGDLRGTPYSQLRIDPFSPDYVPPGGESWPAFHARVRLAWEKIRATAAGTDGNLVVVTHGLVCRALLEHHWALDAGTALPARWENCSFTELDARPPWSIRTLNCVAHLAGDPATADAAWGNRAP